MLTKKKILELHKELWNTIADLSLKYKRCVSKYEALKFLGYAKEEMPRNYCWCCEYIKRKGFYCSNCPVMWGVRKNLPTCMDLGSVYFGIISITDYTNYAKIAETIANLPERE